ncbi:hypothetical protein JOC26_002633 [Sporohalobacter salinus]|nr:hypothetical protein [Sporohalobacter salinus]
MFKKYYHILGTILIVFGLISYFLIHPILGITVFKYIGFTSFIVAGIFPMIYYLKFNEIYFSGKVCKGKEAIFIVIVGVIASIIMFVVLLRSLL